MADGTKRLPSAVREQQILDAAIQMFSVNGYYETSIDEIAAQASISKPMLYLYYGSKEELFGACLIREVAWFIDGVREGIDLEQSLKDLLRNTIVSFLCYIDRRRIADDGVRDRARQRQDASRASWIVMYTSVTSSQAFARTVYAGRERFIHLVARLLLSRHPKALPGQQLRGDGSGAGRRGRGNRHSARHQRYRRRRGGRANDQPVLTRPEGVPVRSGRCGRSRHQFRQVVASPPCP